MSRTMYDALYTSGIPAGAQMAAWYPHDTRNTSGPPKARQLVTIDNTGQHPDCMVLDVESGAATPAAAPAWVATCRAPQPTVYCSLSEAPQIVAVMTGIGRPWYLWVADWTGQPHVPAVAGARVIGCQYESLSAYDVSVITDDGWYPVYIELPGVPGQWLNPQQFFDTVTGTQYVAGVGTTGHVYVTSKPQGGSWSAPVVLP